MAFKFLGEVASVFSKGVKVMAPPLTYRTSLIGSSLRYLKDLLKPAGSVAKEFSNIMWDNPTAKDAQKACDLFTESTGVKMFMTHPGEAYSFNTNAKILINDIKKGWFPKDIKYVMIGHGSGSTINDTWHVAHDPQKTPIFDFINKNIPKGEKVLVNCCEETPKELAHLIPKDKPAIGKLASEFYSSYKSPAKIVVSGRNEIIGGYGNGIASYYTKLGI